MRFPTRNRLLKRTHLTAFRVSVQRIWMFWLGPIAAAPIASQVPGTVDAIRSIGDQLFGGGARSCSLIYGRRGRRGLVAYLAGFAASVPF